MTSSKSARQQVKHFTGLSRIIRQAGFLCAVTNDDDLRLTQPIRAETGNRLT
jgi:hypothetical protein